MRKSKTTKKVVIVLILICFGILLFGACSTSKTDITNEQAEEAAEGIREQMEYILDSAELVYVYAYPSMLEKHGEKIESMDAEQYYLNFAQMLKENKDLISENRAVTEAMNAISMNPEEGTFSVDSYSAGMSAEMGKVPKKMLDLIKNYDEKIQGENIYLEAAHTAFEKIEKIEK